MWESFNQLPIWLKAILIIAPMGVIVGIGVGLFVKIIQSEKIHIGKDGVNFEDLDKIVEQSAEVKNEIKS